MPSEKFFVHKEDGSLVRLKGRLVRFLDEEPPTGSDKSAIRTALEVSPDAEGLVQADVGSSPNEIPVNGMLGDMAYQSSEGISVARAEVESTTGTGSTQALTVTDGSSTKFVVQEDGNVSVGGTTFAAGKFRVEDNNGNHIWLKGRSSDGNSSVSFRNNADSAYNGRIAVDDSTGMNFQVAGSTRCTIDSAGRVGIGTSSPGSYAAAADDLVVATSGTTGVTIRSSSSDNGAIYFADGTSGDERYRGIVRYNHASDQLEFSANGATRWTINSTGNLVAGSGLGIDFGSTNTNTGVTVTGSVMSEYEQGTWTPSFSCTSGAFTTMTMDIINANYVRIGDLVAFYCYIRTDDVDATGAGGSLIITGLPYPASVSSGNNYSAVSVGYGSAWNSAPAGGYVQSSQSYIYPTKRISSITGNLTEMVPGDLTAGTTANQNQLMISGSYAVL